MAILEFINKYLLGASVPVALMLSGVYFLVRLKFFPIVKAGRVSRALVGGGAAPFRALALSLAGTLGVGNVAGVAAAIFAGGFGAIFWMWASAAVAAILKYAEILLAMRHREPSRGGFKGGAPYYVRAVLAPRFPRLATALSTLFALLCVANCLSMGAVMQTNAITDAFGGVFGISPAICGVVLAAATLALLQGGGAAISRLNAYLVPFMSLFYTALSLAVIIPRRAELPMLFSRIISGAFDPRSAAGGFFGFLLSRALRFGVMRGLFSNEAGCGTSPTAHVTSSAPPCEQGFMGIAEVFIDTVVLCTLTALPLMLSYERVAGLSETPMRAVIAAYSSAFSPKFAPLVEGLMAFMVLCFGFAAISCLFHYAAECLGFLSRRRFFRRALALLYVLAVFAGAVTTPSAAWAISDVTVGVMTLINLSVLLYSSREISDETQKYFEKSPNNRKFDKKFTKSS